MALVVGEVCNWHQNIEIFITVEFYLKSDSHYLTICIIKHGTFYDPKQHIVHYHVPVNECDIDMYILNFERHFIRYHQAMIIHRRKYFVSYV